jgi:hypothetical protein
LRRYAAHWHRCLWPSALLLAAACAAQPKTSTEPPSPQPCLPSGDGYLRARVSGAMNIELDWDNQGTECTGAVRPTDGGIRLRFSHPERDGTKLVFVFGIANLREGQSAKTLPVNVTLIREGAAEFYSTQGDDKCMLDEVKQSALVGIPHRARSYRVVARGFCTEPARAVRGEGAILVSRFDFAGRVDFEVEDTSPEEPIIAADGANPKLLSD